MGIVLKYDPVAGAALGAYASGVSKSMQRREKYNEIQQVSDNRTRAYAARGRLGGARGAAAGHWEDPSAGLIGTPDYRDFKARKKGWDRKRRLGKVTGPSPFEPRWVPDPVVDPREAERRAEQRAKEDRDRKAEAAGKKGWDDWGTSIWDNKKDAPDWAKPGKRSEIIAIDRDLRPLLLRPDVDRTDPAVRAKIDGLIKRRREIMDSVGDDPAIAEKEREKEELAAEMEREKAAVAQEKMASEVRDIMGEKDPLSGELRFPEVEDAIEEYKKRRKALGFPDEAAGEELGTGVSPRERGTIPGALPGEPGGPAFGDREEYLRRGGEAGGSGPAVARPRTPEEMEKWEREFIAAKGPARPRTPEELRDSHAVELEGSGGGGKPTAEEFEQKWKDAEVGDVIRGPDGLLHEKLEK